MTEHNFVSIILLLSCVHFVLPYCIYKNSKPCCTPTKPLDLSFFFDNQTYHWGTDTPFHFTKVTFLSNPFHQYKEYESAEHVGTHMDAPYHYYLDARRIGDIPIENFIARGVMVDAGEEAAADHNYALPVSKLEQWEMENGELPNRCVVLFNFDWAQYYDNKTAYFGTSNPNPVRPVSFPGISAEAAQWLADRKHKILGVGMDVPSPEPGNVLHFPAHVILLKANFHLLEAMALNNTCLPPQGFSLITLPMKLREGDAAPVRVLAFPNSDLVSQFYPDEFFTYSY